MVWEIKRVFIALFLLICSLIRDLITAKMLEACAGDDRTLVCGTSLALVFVTI